MCLEQRLLYGETGPQGCLPDIRHSQDSQLITLSVYMVEPTIPILSFAIWAMHGPTGFYKTSQTCHHHTEHLTNHLFR